MSSVPVLPPSVQAKRHLQTEVLTWRELTLLLSYEADWMGLTAAGLRPPLAHLELQVLAPRGAPSPLSDDQGYWSDFLDPREAIGAGGPRVLAMALLDEFAEALTWRVSWARWDLDECSDAAACFPQRAQLQSWRVAEDV
jgi:hypothetical protein